MFYKKLWRRLLVSVVETTDFSVGIDFIGRSCKTNLLSLKGARLLGGLFLFAVDMEIIICNHCHSFWKVVFLLFSSQIMDIIQFRFY